MGYVLLCLENLAMSLLLLATLEACLGHWQRRRLRVIAAFMAALVVLAVYLGLVVVLGLLKFTMGLASSWFYPLAVMTGSYMVGAGWILIAGWRRSEDGLSGPHCAIWARGRLAIALAVAAALHLMTFWNLDLAIRQRLETLRAEGGALALSAAPPRMPDRDNAALVYQQAFEKMGDSSSWPKAYAEKWCHWLYADARFRPDATVFDPKDTELRAFLKQQAAALDLLQKAGDKPGCYFDRDYSRLSFDTSLAEWVRLVPAAKLLSLDARCKAADGDLHGALVDCQVILTMAEHASSDPWLIVLLISSAIDSTGMRTLEAVLASGPRSADNLGVVDPGRNFSYQRAFQRALRMEEACGQAMFYDVATGKNSFFDLEALPPQGTLLVASNHGVRSSLSPVPGGRRPGGVLPAHEAIPAIGQPTLFPVEGRLGRLENDGVFDQVALCAARQVFGSDGSKPMPSVASCAWPWRHAAFRQFMADCPTTPGNWCRSSFRRCRRTSLTASLCV